MTFTLLTIRRDTAVIHLNKGLHTIIDLADCDRVSQFHWWFCEGYAISKHKGKRLRLHRFLTNAPKGREVDHANGNRLDNRRVNLRVCNHSNNQHNQRKTRGVSQYKGVYRRRDREKWSAMIGLNGKRHSLGYFTHEDDAARAYDAAALKHYGDFAHLNFPPCKKE